MHKVSIVAIAVAVTLAAAGAGAVFAADQPSQTGPATHRVDKDFGKLSTDGFKGFRDVRLARIAIFDGQIGEAKKDIAQAQSAFAKAKTDDTSFMKAEADLKPPANLPVPQGRPSPSSTAVSWLPVDGSLAMDEDYTAVPAKAAGVSKADTALKNGDKAGALKALKLAEINATFVTEVVPLDKTVNGVDQAAQLLGQSKYYEANQVLKGVEDNARFDAVDVSSEPGKTGNTASNAHETSKKS